MADTQRFFSRTQLNVIIVIATVAILVLSSGGSEEYPPLQRQVIDGLSLYRTAPLDGRVSVRFSFALPPDSPEPVRALAYEQLRQRLLATPEAFEAVTPVARDYPDRFVVGLNADSAEALIAALPLLTARLSDGIAPADWASTWRQLRARRYLEHQDPTLDAAADIPLRARALDRALYSRRLGSASLVAEHPALERAVAQALSRLPEGQRWPVPVVAADSHSLLLPGRRSPEFPQLLLAIRLLEPLAAAEGVPIRWQPWGDHSRLESDREGALAPLLSALASTDADTLAQAKTQLLAEFHRRLKQPATLAEQLETIAFYDLPLDYLPTFAAKIEALTPDTLAALVNRWGRH